MGTWEFVPTPRGWAASLGAAERAALGDVVDDVVELLGGDEPATPWVPGLRPPGEPVAPPTDPALRRLLPDGSRADPDVAAEFRRLTEDEVRSAKVTNLLALRAALDAPTGQVVVEPDQAPAVAAALTDLRLVLAERLGIRTEEDADAVYRLVVGGGPIDPTDADAMARRFLATVSALLGVLQESLVTLMLDALPDVPDDGADEPDGASGPGEG